MTVLGTSFVAVSSMGSHYMVDLQQAAEIANEDRRTLMKVAFPYVEFGEPEKVKVEELDLDAIRKKLREINARNKAKAEAKAAGKTEETDAPVGQEGGK